MRSSAEVDNYISRFSTETRKVLEEMRSTLKLAAPKADEVMSYGIPTLTLGGNLVHFGAFKNHIGFYPGSSGVAAFQEELSVYKGAKGSIQFPMDKPLPLDLITRIAKFRVEENLAKLLAKSAKKKK